MPTNLTMLWCESDASNAHCAFDGSPDDCPYNFYRTSGDINPNFNHVMWNVNTVVRYLGTENRR